MDWKGLLTSFEGRITRKMWWSGILLLLPLSFLIFLILSVGISLTNSLDPIGRPDEKLSIARNAEYVKFAMLAIVAFPLTALMKKRLHDRDRPNWFVYVFWAPTVLGLLLNFLGLRYALYEKSGDVMVLSTWAGSLVDMAGALIGVWALVELGILKGTFGPNRHGPDPLMVQSATTIAAEKSKATSTKASRNVVPKAQRSPGAVHRWWHIFTSFDGRISRKQFWRGLLLLVSLQVVNLILILIVYLAVVEQFYPNQSDSPGTMELVARQLPAIAIWFVIGLWPTLAIFTRRWHDQEKSGWWNLSSPPFVFFVAVVIALVVLFIDYEGPLLILLPIAIWASVIWTIIALGFFRGTDGPNRYGPNPSAA